MQTVDNRHFTMFGTPPLTASFGQNDLQQYYWNGNMMDDSTNSYPTSMAPQQPPPLITTFSPMSSSMSGSRKRRRRDINDEAHWHPHTLADSPSSGASPNATSAGVSSGGLSSSFRNVSACNRCRLRKNRCDQRLPACTSCEKADVRCVGYDPITKREIPRSYVHYLESRLAYLESLLTHNGIPYPPAEDFPDLPAPIPAPNSSASTPVSTTATLPPSPPVSHPPLASMGHSSSTPPPHSNSHSHSLSGSSTSTPPAHFMPLPSNSSTPPPPASGHNGDHGPCLCCWPMTMPQSQGLVMN